MNLVGTVYIATWTVVLILSHEWHFELNIFRPLVHRLQDIVCFSWRTIDLLWILRLLLVENLLTRVLCTTSYKQHQSGLFLFYIYFNLRTVVSSICYTELWQYFQFDLVNIIDIPKSVFNFAISILAYRTVHLFTSSVFQLDNFRYVFLYCGAQFMEHLNILKHNFQLLRVICSASLYILLL